MSQFEKRITLSRRSGQTCEFEVKRCREEDLDTIMALQQQVFDGLNDPELYALIDAEEFLESLKVDHFFGVYHDDRLVAATLMIDNRISYRNYGTYVGYPDEKLPYVVSMETTFVDVEYRGFGLQQYLTAYREKYAYELGAKEAFVTISPRNEHSLHNLMAMGYEIIETRPLYEGSVRHILRKYL